jgi:myo-inositol-1(or 4)-monophosphatase
VKKSNSVSVPRALATAARAARAAGALMRKNWRSPKLVKAATQYDIKLDLDVRCQRVIEKTLRADFPHINMLAEEGDSGDVSLEYRWVVDPIDGTVNYAYGIPHAAVSIALQKRVGKTYETLLGVIYEPFTDEIWTATQTSPARLNGRVIHTAKRPKLAECIVTTGFAKSEASLNEMLPFFGQLARNVRKVRMLGSAALALTYVATGRLDAYIESRVNLWDIAAGALILERAGGEFWFEPFPGEPHVLRLIANNGHIRKKLQALGLFKNKPGLAAKPK